MRGAVLPFEVSAGVRSARVLSAGVVSAVVGVSVLLVPAVPAAAAGCAVPKGVYAAATPWAQRQLDLPAVAPLSIGTGVRIAVLGTGIDAGNAQFARGQVQAGQDVLAGSGAADTDCDGRGTFAAGIIGAQPVAATTVVGVAPGAQLIPIRYTQSADSSTAGGDPAKLAAAVNAATALRPQIVLVAVPVTADSAALRAAVVRAQAAGALVVSPAAAAKAGQATYPTSYPGVVAVAGINAAGAPVTVETGRYLAVSAPGNALVGLAAGAKGLGHLWPADDPSFAAAYVAGLLADVLAYRPSLTSAQVLNRVLATAGGQSHSNRTGWGLIDPIRALTAELPADVTPSAAVAGPAAGRVTPARPTVSPPPPGRRTGYLTFGGLGLAVLLALLAGTVRRGARRRWRPGIAVPVGSAVPPGTAVSAGTAVPVGSAVSAGTAVSPGTAVRADSRSG